MPRELLSRRKAPNWVLIRDQLPPPPWSAPRTWVVDNTPVLMPARTPGADALNWLARLIVDPPFHQQCVAYRKISTAVTTEPARADAIVAYGQPISAVWVPLK